MLIYAKICNISIANLKNHYLQARCTLDNLHNFNY